MTKKVMIQGTASGVGKSTVVTAICRILYTDGHRVAPFKGQNMAATSYITKDGLELGIGQSVQAKACNLLPNAHMNPILLKPAGNYEIDLYVQGRPFKKIHSEEFKLMKPSLKEKVLESYEKLASENEFMVIEGAGSAAEINMMEDDISNMGIAEMLDAPVILVADIDRGGVFASIYGTIMLQSAENKDRIKGVIINKFRGKVEFLESGIKKIEELTGVPVLGVLPHVDIYLAAEDSIVESKALKLEAITDTGEIEKQNQEELAKVAQIFRDHIDFEKIYQIIK